MNELEFPKLGLKFHLDPVAFSIGDFTVAWYGIIIAIGFVLALWFGLRQSKKFGINPDKMIDVVIGGIIGGIVGARLYFILFRLDTFIGDSFGETLLNMLDIRRGGLAIYGGLIGAVLVGALICKWRKVKLFPMLDVAGMGFLIGQGIGRWGNFVNIEAYGSNTDLPWGMWSESMTGDMLTSAGVDFDPYLPVHPCFLYESIWCLLGFLVLFFIWRKHRKFDGELFLGYLAWYGAGRMVIEGLRTDSLMIGSTRLRISQLLAGLLVLVSVVTIIVIRSKIKRSGDPDMLKPYVKTEAWQEELQAMEQEAKAYKERKERRKAGLPLEEETEEEEYTVIEDAADESESATDAVAAEEQMPATEQAEETMEVEEDGSKDH